MAIFGFRMVENSYAILKDGHTMFPEDVVNDLKVLNRDLAHYKAEAEKNADTIRQLNKFINERMEKEFIENHRPLSAPA